MAMAMSRESIEAVNLPSRFLYLRLPGIDAMSIAKAVDKLNG
jgi:hypothetical protein